MLKLPKIEDRRGNLSFIESGAQPICPFEIERVYWIYDVPAGRVRHGRRLSRTSEMIVAMSGSFDVTLRHPSGIEERIHLNRSDCGVVVEPGTWRQIDNFSTNSVVAVLASGPYDPDEYSWDLPEQSFELPVYAKSPHPEHNAPSEPCIMQLPRHRHDNGSLTEVQNANPEMPFNIRRVFYIYDVPADTSRGSHAHHDAKALIISLSGSFDVVTDDGINEPLRFTLNRPYQALFVPEEIWNTLDNFSGGAVCMVLTSHTYSESDYIRDYDDFKQLKANK